jgi:hypothetical protein
MDGRGGISMAVNITQAILPFAGEQRVAVKMHVSGGGTDPEITWYLYTADKSKLVGTLKSKGYGAGDMNFLIEEYPDLIRPYPNSNAIEFYVYVKINRAYGDDKTDEGYGTVTLVSNSVTQPKISNIVVTPSNVVLDNNELIVQGKNGIKVSYTSEGQLGASVTSESWSVEGMTYAKDKPSKTLITSGDVIVTLSATDTRGLVHNFKHTINVYQYSKPMIAPISGESLVTANRVDENNTATDRGENVFIRASKKWSTIGGNNGCKLRWRFRESSSQEWSAYSELQTDENNEYIGRIPGQFSRDSKYKIELSAIDDFGAESESKELDIYNAVFMHRNGVKNSIAFGGRVTKSNALEVYQDAYFNQDAYFRGGMGIILDGKLYNITLKEVNGELVLGATEITTYKGEEL